MNVHFESHIINNKIYFIVCYISLIFIVPRLDKLKPKPNLQSLENIRQLIFFKTFHVRGGLLLRVHAVGTFLSLLLINLEKLVSQKFNMHSDGHTHTHPRWIWACGDAKLSDDPTDVPIRRIIDAYS